MAGSWDGRLARESVLAVCDWELKYGRLPSRLRLSNQGQVEVLISSVVSEFEAHVLHWLVRRVIVVVLSAEARLVSAG